MTNHRPTVVCAWCHRLLVAGNQDVSHGICLACERAVLADLRARHSHPERDGDEAS